MRNLINKKCYKVKNGEIELVIYKYFMNNILMNLRVFSYIESELSEIFPDNMKEEERDCLLGNINNINNLISLEPEKEREIDNILLIQNDTAKKIIKEVVEAENKKLVYMDEICGINYMIIAPKDESAQFFLEMYSVRIEDEGKEPSLYLINADYGEIAFIDYLSSKHSISKPIYVRINDIFYFAVNKVNDKTQRLYSLLVIENLYEEIFCNKAYLLEKNKSQLEPFDIKKFNTSIEKLLKKTVKETCDNFVCRIKG